MSVNWTAQADIHILFGVVLLGTLVYLSLVVTRRAGLIWVPFVAVGVMGAAAAEDVHASFVEAAAVALFLLGGIACLWWFVLNHTQPIKSIRALILRAHLLAAGAMALSVPVYAALLMFLDVPLVHAGAIASTRPIGVLLMAAVYWPAIAVFIAMGLRQGDGDEG